MSITSKSAKEDTPVQDKLSSMDYWFAVAVLGDRRSELIENMYEALAEETPPILSVVGERTCNLQCQHCIFQLERSSSRLSMANSLTEAVNTIVQQMGPDPIVVHEGRIFQPWHLDWLKAIRGIRPDSRVGMIDNGTFLRHKDAIAASGFAFDWLDISVDGSEEINNRQRGSARSFCEAMNGIANARQFLVSGGRVTSLFTLTSVNYAAVLETCCILSQEVDEWHITTLSPARQEIADLAVSDEQFAIAWQQVVAASRERQLFFRIYVNDDLPKLVKAVGREKFVEALRNAKIADVTLTLELDGVPVIYYPTSVVVGEEVIIDADAYHRLPYSIAYTLEELRSGNSRLGEYLGEYTVGLVDKDTNLSVAVRKAVAQWSEEFGRNALQQEIQMFSEISQRERR